MSNTGNAADDPQALFEQAVAHFEAGDAVAARDALVRLNELVPDHPHILNHLGTTTHQIGDEAAARTYFERAVAVQPDFEEAWRNLGVLAFNMGDVERSRVAFATLCDLTPADPQVHAWLGDALQAQERYAEAVAAYERSIALDPERANVWAKISRVQLQDGRWEDAIETADRATAVQPGHTGALAQKSVALAELGRDAEFAELVDFDRLIQEFRIDTPAGYRTMAGFNDALVAYCTGHPSLTFNPANNSTQDGSQTANLGRDSDSGPIRQLIDIVDDCADVYIADHPLAPAHPFLARQPSSWDIAIWGTVLGRQGHQRPHIHRDGWLSGVYYARVPEVIRDAGDDQAGWIEFGRPQPYPKAKAAPVVRRRKPVEGTLFLFPSYFYHRTIPFEADVQRVSIAFDLIPT